MKANKMEKDFNFGEKIGAMQSDVSHIKETVDELTTNLKDYMSVNRSDMAKHCEDSDKKYVTKIEFAPYQKGINWLLTFIAIGALGFLGSVSLDIYKTYIKQKAREDEKLVDNRQA